MTAVPIEPSRSRKASPDVREERLPVVSQFADLGVQRLDLRPHRIVRLFPAGKDPQDQDLGFPLLPLVHDRRTLIAPAAVIGYCEARHSVRVSLEVMP